MAALLLAGCAADYANYPSLARRPAERVSGSAEVVPATVTPPPLAPPPSPELITRLSQLSDQAEAAHNAFGARRAEAQRAVSAASGASVGSESWAQASIALAGLETARSQAMIALADLDALYAGESTEGRDITAITETRNRVIGWIGEEDDVLAQLRGRVTG